MQRCILHLDLDSFFVSVECLKNTKLTGKPVIIGGSADRGVVSSCSYEARAYGVSSAMPIKMARILCPEGIYIKGDMERYAYYSRIVGEVIQENVPVFEKASIDEFYADLSGMDRFFGCYSFSNELAHKVLKQTGLPSSWALSVNKLVSKVATNEAKPRGSLLIDAGDEKGFVAPLPVKKIPGIGLRTFKQLSAMGVKRVCTLASVPIPFLEKEFGKTGKLLWEKANAIDHREVIPYSEAKSISTEKTFETDTTDLDFIKSCLFRMGEKLGFQLRTQGKLTGCVTVKVRYSDYNTYTKQKQLPLTASDSAILDTIVDLFGKLHQKRLLVRLVGVQLSHLVPGNYQIDLFDDTMAMINLNEAMDKIKHKYGGSSIMRAISLSR
jgi:DNA polymerase-4